MNKTGIIYADGGDSAVAGALFGKPMAAAQDYISSSVNTYIQAIGDTTSNIGQAIQSRFNEVRSSAAIQHIENMRNRVSSIWQTDSIRHLENISAIQQAPLSMQRWVIANPYLRKHYNRGGLEAYDNQYVDIRPGGFGPTHYDYRRVMNGIVSLEEDKLAEYTNYYEPGIDEKDLLSIVEKASILATWNVINEALDECKTIDPTSVWNSTLS